MKPTKNPNQLYSARGFALIVTLTLMVLLTIIAVGLLSISSVALRTTQQGEAKATARANARMALMLAMGELQLYTGADTRITARADIFDEGNSRVMGAWESWMGDNHEDTGRPVSPGSDYAAEKSSRFLKWLVSAEEKGNSDPGVVPDTTAGSGKATLVGAGSVGQDVDEIHLVPTPSNSPGRQGSYAWWVGGENIKARLTKLSTPGSSAENGQWASFMKSNASADPEVFDLDESLLISDDPNQPDPLDKAITLEQLNLLEERDTPISETHFHDLSVSSVGLLTNAATGGWKKDLSLFTENSAQNGGPIGNEELPLFRLSPEEDSMTRLPRGGDLRGSNSVFYPWANYRGSANDHPIYQHAAVASWNNLIDYASLYKETREDGTSIATNSYAWRSDAGTTFEFLHEVRVLPVIARIQWVHSHFARPRLSGGQVRYQPYMVLTPVVTIWNPYNLRVTSDRLRIDIPRPLPTAFKFTIGGTETNFQAITADNRSVNYPEPSISGSGSLRYNINNEFTLQPGETQVFSPSGRDLNGRTTSNLVQGYNPGTGPAFALVDNDGNPIMESGNSRIEVEVAFDATYRDGNNGVGIYLNMSPGGSLPPHLVYRMVYTPEVANAIYPTDDRFSTSEPLSQLSTPIPFLTTIFGARMASRTHLASKGLLQSSPLVNYTAMGGKDVAEPTIRREYRGSNHPVNSPFDYSFQSIVGNDDSLPNADNDSNRGFIVTGFGSDEGLSRCVIAEIPTRPLQSLAELQHWDLRYENPLPPFAFNLIGNSNATPLIADDSVFGQYDDDVNLQYDDSYCANHVLFDDWFLSSIAPDPENLGTNGRDLEDVFTDFIDGTEELPNAAYRPIALDAGSDANQIFTDEVDTADSWKTIASRLEVEGMFNVNSASVTAWRALLRHARNQRVPFIDSENVSNSNYSVELSDETDHVISRFSVAGDRATTSDESTSGGFEGANEFTGYRVLDEDLIDELAQRIVDQVRLRGPFLSLSEFVNRQLSSDTDLALAGAIQAALDEMDDELYGGITDAITPRPTDRLPGGINAEYEFEEAADGQATFGLPGWTRQADVLRPLAPILTVRDDTFTIRAYGDARDATGSRITAKAVCEAVVRRTRDYVDPTDAPDLETFPTSQQNQTFGRRYEIVSFRWLSPSEI